MKFLTWLDIYDESDSLPFGLLIGPTITKNSIIANYLSERDFGYSTDKAYVDQNRKLRKQQNTTPEYITMWKDSK